MCHKYLLQGADPVGFFLLPLPSHCSIQEALHLDSTKQCLAHKTQLLLVKMQVFGVFLVKTQVFTLQDKKKTKTHPNNKPQPQAYSCMW